MPDRDNLCLILARVYLSPENIDHPPLIRCRLATADPEARCLEAYLNEYVKAAGIGAEKASPLFRTLGGHGRRQLTGERMTRQDARRMIVRRALRAGIITRLGCHTFRVTGITVYLLNGGLLEYGQQMAAHESDRATKLYDRRNDQGTLDQSS